MITLNNVMTRYQQPQCDKQRGSLKEQVHATKQKFVVSTVLLLLLWYKTANQNTKKGLYTMKPNGCWCFNKQLADNISILFATIPQPWTKRRSTLPPFKDDPLQSTFVKWHKSPLPYRHAYK